MSGARRAGDPPSGDPRRRALGEIVNLAREDRRRGVRAWFDPELAEELRLLVREIDAGSPARASAAAPPPATSESREPATPDRSESPSTAQTARSTPPVPASGASPSAGAEVAMRPRGTRPQWGPPPEATGREPDWLEQLRATGAEAAACRACGLCATRTTVVFGAGDARVPLVFVGEAPGADEDAQGVPFVGRAGQLLTKIIESIGLSREEVYIANVLKCRPPGNRNPEPGEIAACRGYLERQLAILRPRVICTLGLFASQLLLGSAQPIGKLRGRLFEQDGYRILPTYHPAALLRNPSLKATVWEDMQLLRRILDE